jgi:hypothetical protein
MYVADRDNMGKINLSSPSVNSNPNIYQDIAGALNGVFSMPAYFNGTVYYASVSGRLRAFPFTNARLATSATSQSTHSFAFPGATPGVSSNGTSNAIVWATDSNLSNPAVLRAYDANNLATELYNSTQAPAGRDSFGQGGKYITPTIANGKVYVGTQNSVGVFGEF